MLPEIKETDIFTTEETIIKEFLNISTQEQEEKRKPNIYKKGKKQEIKFHKGIIPVKSDSLIKSITKGFKVEMKSILEQENNTRYINENPLSYEEEDRIIVPEIEAEIAALSQKNWEEIIEMYPDFEERLGDMKEELKEIYEEGDFSALWSFLEGCGTLKLPDGYEDITDYDEDIW